MITSEALRKMAKQYPVGTRIKLVHMEDIQAPPVNTFGTVKGVDDIGSLLVAWDNGSSLNVLLDVDVIERVITTRCYKQEREWKTREEAIDFFKNCISANEGAERDRYTTILLKLERGMTYCSDGIC